jgi:hypothetical protein
MFIVTLKSEGEPFPESHRAHLVVGFEAWHDWSNRKT